MKRITSLLLAAFCLLGITSCAQKPQTVKNDKVLVAFFSATGHTKRTAEVIATVTGGTLYEIRPEQPYTDADLDWTDKQSRSSVEMADKTSRPAIVTDLKNAADYDTIYIGFPIWWDLAPHAVNTFLEKYDFSGKTVIPFATSGGSSIDNSERALRSAYPRLNWQPGKLLNAATESEVKSWIRP